MAGCLDGIRVLELARYQAGPRGGMILSDLGAEVIKIEKMGGEDTRKSAPVVNGQSIYLRPGHNSEAISPGELGADDRRSERTSSAFVE